MPPKKVQPVRLDLLPHCVDVRPQGSTQWRPTAYLYVQIPIAPRLSLPYVLAGPARAKYAIIRTECAAHLTYRLPDHDGNPSALIGCDFARPAWQQMQERSGMPGSFAPSSLSLVSTGLCLMYTQQ
jgi:hypothetical protein